MWSLGWQCKAPFLYRSLSGMEKYNLYKNYIIHIFFPLGLHPRRVCTMWRWSLKDMPLTTWLRWRKRTILSRWSPSKSRSEEKKFKIVKGVKVQCCVTENMLKWMEQNGLDWKGPLRVQSHCSEQGHLQPNQAAQSSIQPALECFPGLGHLPPLWGASSSFYIPLPMSLCC